jgi:hypothetical protein
MRGKLLLFLGMCTSAFADLQWEKRDIDFYPAAQDAAFVARFAFENTGKTPVTIGEIQSCCSCVTASSAKKTYKPGEKGEIVANFEFGKRVGIQKKELLISTDDAQESKVVLKFQVHIPELLQLTPAFVSWEKKEENRSKTIRIKVIHDAPIQVLKVSSNEGWTTELQTIKAGSEYAIQVSPKDTSISSWGTLRIDTDFPVEKRKTFYGHAQVK